MNYEKYIITQDKKTLPDPDEVQRRIWEQITRYKCDYARDPDYVFIETEEMESLLRACYTAGVSDYHKVGDVISQPPEPVVRLYGVDVKVVTTNTTQEFLRVMEPGQLATLMASPNETTRLLAKQEYVRRNPNAAED